LYTDANAVIYTVNVSCDDRLGEDKTTNRMVEAISVWSQVTSSDALRDANFLLLFTFEDQFQRKLNTQVDESSFFCDIFRKRPNLEEAKDAVAQKFLSQTALDKNRVRVVFVDLFDDGSFGAAFDSIAAFLDNV